MRVLPTQSFWMVWGVGGGDPTVRHPSRQLAEDEARRLARKVPGKTFVVLEAVAAVIKREFDTVTFRAAHVVDLDDDQIPF